MEWLLIVFLRYGESVGTFKKEFRNKEECTYVGSWFLEQASEKVKISRISAKCFEVQNVQVNK